MVPTPYDMRFTAKLIRRDIKNIAAKCTKKARKLFSRGNATNASVALSDYQLFQNRLHMLDDSYTSTDNALTSQDYWSAVSFIVGECDTDTQPQGSDQVQDTSDASRDDASSNQEYSSAVSFIIDDCDPATQPQVPGQAQDISNVSRNDASSDQDYSSAVSFTIDDSNPVTSPEVSSQTQEACNTLYYLLTTRLKSSYALRGRDLPLSQRWAFRGAWLLLHLATQFCASNPSYDICRDGTTNQDETALLLEVLQHSVLSPFEPSPTRVSQMPTMPYSRRANESLRHDSILSTISVRPHSPPSPALLWHIIFAGALQGTKTVHAAEQLLNQIWPQKDATKILDAIGDPAKRLSVDDEMQLRDRLAHALYPEYYVKTR